MAAVVAIFDDLNLRKNSSKNKSHVLSSHTQFQIHIKSESIIVSEQYLQFQTKAGLELWRLKFKSSVVRLNLRIKAVPDLLQRNWRCSPVTGWASNATARLERFWISINFWTGIFCFTLANVDSCTLFSDHLKHKLHLELISSWRLSWYWASGI